VAFSFITSIMILLSNGMECPVSLGSITQHLINRLSAVNDYPCCSLKGGVAYPGGGGRSSPKRFMHDAGSEQHAATLCTCTVHA